MKTWVVNGSFVELLDGSKPVSSTVDDIYRAIIENDSPWPDLAPGRIGAAARIEFSRYPASIRATLTDDPQGRIPALGFCIKTQGGETHQVPAETLRRGHIIVDGVWYPIAPESSVGLLELLTRANVQPDSYRPTTLRGLLTLKSEASVDGQIEDHMSKGGTAALQFSGTDNATPVGVMAKLYPYQVDGWRWLRFVIREQLGGLLADEMGLGKTLQVISALRDSDSGKKCSPTLVVSPGSLLENWKREIAKFAPELSVLKHKGTLRTGRPGDLLEFDVVLTSYETAVRDLSLFKMIDWAVVVVDEAQNIKNPDALRTRSIKQIPRRVGLAMTGTPVENRLADLWSIIDFTVPGYLGEIEEFHSKYDNNVDAAARLEPLVTPLILRRMVADVARDLPSRIDIPEFVDLTEEESAEYDRIRTEILANYGKAASLVSLTALRQFCAHPDLLTIKGTDFKAGTFTKFERLREIVAEIIQSRDKAIIFTSYTEMADLIVNSVSADHAIFAETLDGRLAIDDRQLLIDRFSDIDGPAILVLNPKAGGSGLNITAANHVIHYNLEWNPAIEDQASARAHRRGQQRPVTVRRLICAATVEEIVNDRVERKRQISSTAIVGVLGSEQDFADVFAALQQSPLQAG